MYTLCMTWYIHTRHVCMCGQQPVRNVTNTHYVKCCFLFVFHTLSCQMHNRSHQSAQQDHSAAHVQVELKAAATTALRWVCFCSRLKFITWMAIGHWKCFNFSNFTNIQECLWYMHHINFHSFEPWSGHVLIASISPRTMVESRKSMPVVKIQPCSKTSS